MVDNLFPIKRIKRGSSIVLYGAGKHGKRLFEANQELQWCKIIAVVDERYTEISDFGACVMPLNAIIDLHYDGVLISIVDVDARKQAYNDLVSLGVEKDIIIDKNGDEMYKYAIPDRLLVGFRTSGGMGDYVMQLSVYQDIVRQVPDCIIDVIAEKPVVAKSVFWGQPNLRHIVKGFTEKRIVEKYDVYIAMSFQIEILRYDMEKTRKLAFHFSENIEKQIKYNEEFFVSSKDFQYSNAAIVHRARILGLNKYTIWSCSGSFDIKNRHVDLFLSNEAKKRYVELGLRKNYITFNFGADDFLKNGKRQTKQWPYEYHEKLNRLIKERFPDIEIVQLGATTVETIPGADRYILGEDFETVKWILKNSLLHFDCEGGLVHMATQLGTICCVVFGPTPIWFLGYEQNVNIAPHICGECKGIIKEWFTTCMKYERNECMYSIHPDEVMGYIDSIVTTKLGEVSMEEKRDITVIVPVYNVSEYLERCLESLRKQQMKNVEFLCIDDGSTDSSGDIIDRFVSLDSRFRAIHKENSGYGSTMNLGLHEALGTYIAILEGDDFAAPDMLDKLYGTAIEKDAEIVKANYYRYQGNDETKILVNVSDGFPVEKVITPDDYPEIMTINHCVWNALYKKAFLEENEIRFLETPGASYQDVGFLCKCWYQVKKLVFVETPVVYYNVVNPLSSVKSERKVFCVSDEYNEVISYLDKHESCRERARKTLAETMFTDYENTFYRIDFPFQYGFIYRFRDDIKTIIEKGYMAEEDKSMLSLNHRDQISELISDTESFYDRHSSYKQYVENNAPIRDKEMAYELFYPNFCALNTVFWELISKSGAIFIYGVGEVAAELIHILEEKGYKSLVKGVLVSSVKENNKVFLGIPVLGVEEAEDNKETLVVVAVEKNEQKNAVELLKNSGYRMMVSCFDTTQLTMST